MALRGGGGVTVPTLGQLSNNALSGHTKHDVGGKDMAPRAASCDTQCAIATVLPSQPIGMHGLIQLKRLINIRTIVTCLF